MLILYFISGCVVGSFLCLVAERVPIGGSILHPASQCSSCKTKLRVFELIPLISILFLRFRCRSCKKKLSTTYFFSEFICGLLCLFAALKFTYPLYSLFFLFTAVVLSLTDIFYLIIEPKIFYLLSFFLCIWHLYLNLPIHFSISVLFFLGSYSLNTVFPNSIGGGDILLVTLWSALLGANATIFLLFIASSCGILFILIHRLLLKKTLEQLPFVPFLSLGLFFVFLCT